MNEDIVDQFRHENLPGQLYYTADGDLHSKLVLLEEPLTVQRTQALLLVFQVNACIVVKYKYYYMQP